MVTPVRLGIDVVTYPDEPDWPQVEFSIDGRPMLTGTKLADWNGFDPEELLGDDRPLLPDPPSRRVAVYFCSCRVVGCGVVAPLIGIDGVVRWTDFRDFVGVFNGADSR